jgi:hypothetical protein
MDWRVHKHNCRFIIDDDDFSYGRMKEGSRLFYGRISGYDFQIIRQMARNSDDVKLYDNRDFNHPHRIAVMG